VSFHQFQRRLIAAFAIPALAACSSYGGSAGGTLDLTNPSIVPPLRMNEVRLLRGMTDANILGHMAMSDSVEVVMAKYAEQRTKDDAVLEFARQMDVEHSTNLAAERQLAQNTGLGMNTMVGEMRVSHMGTLVDSVGPQVSDINFDHNYVVANVQMHRHMLAELEQLQGVAKNDKVQDHIAATMATVERHLSEAHDLAVKHGYMTANAWNY
jgi:putative membrane protein